MKRDWPTGTDAVHAGTPYHRPHNTLSPSIAQTATFTFRDTDTYASAVREQIEHLRKRTQDLPDEVLSRYKLDEKVVAEVLAAAPFWARPGLALPGVQHQLRPRDVVPGVELEADAAVGPDELEPQRAV